MGFKQTLSLVGVVAALSGTAMAEETKVAMNTTQDSVEYRVKKGTKAPDAQLYGLVGEWKKVEGLAKESKWDEILDNYFPRVERALDYNFNSLSIDDQKRLSIVFSDVGSAFYGQNQFEEALPLKRIATDLDPTQLMYRNLALTYTELGKKKKDKELLMRSVTLYENTIGINPTSELAQESRKMISLIQTKYLPIL